MSVTIITRWESSQMPKDTEWRMWKQLVSSYKVDKVIAVPQVPDWDCGRLCVEVNTMEEALAMVDKSTLCFLEPKGEKSITELPDGDITLVLGNTEHSNAEYAEPEQMYHISTSAGPTKAHLYGTNAAAIALATRWQK